MSDNRRELYGINSRPRRSKNFKVAGMDEFPLLGITPKQCGIETTRNTLCYFFDFHLKHCGRNLLNSNLFFDTISELNFDPFLLLSTWNFDESTFYEKIIIFLFQMN